MSSNRPHDLANFTAAEIADRMGLTTRQLQDLRLRGIGPQIVQRDLSIHYELAEVREIERHEAMQLIEHVLASERPLILLRAMAEQVGFKLSPILQQVALPARSSVSDQRLTFTTPVQLEAVSQPGLSSDANLPKQPVVPATAAAEYAAPVAPAVATVASTIIPITRTTQPTPALDTTAWYLVYTKAQQEEIARINLERQGYECYLPKLRIEKIRRRKADIVEEPMFPRYLFVRLDLSGQGKSWTPIRSTLGVQQLIYFGSRAACVDDHLIEWLRQREQRHPTEPMFKAGDAVVVTDGPFAGIEAIYQTTDAERRAMILLEILSKPVTMQIDHARLRKTV